MVEAKALAAQAMAAAVPATVATVAAATVAIMVAEASGKASKEAAPLLKCLPQGHRLVLDCAQYVMMRWEQYGDKSRPSNADPSVNVAKESLVPNKLATAPPQTAKVSF